MAATTAIWVGWVARVQFLAEGGLKTMFRLGVGSTQASALYSKASEQNFVQPPESQ